MSSSLPSPFKCYLCLHLLPKTFCMNYSNQHVLDCPAEIGFSSTGEPWSYFLIIPVICGKVIRNFTPAQYLDQ